jgi:hypothetical protein
METFEVQFTIGKETKNTFKFDEVPPPGKPNVMQSIYLPKWLLHGRNVETVTVTFQLPKAA